ncbi:MAG: trypsin-like peptidase domain-containing protein [Anaerolineales bacterium]|nr:trypsin-like peptidase domain-containing protein [Anaerolineales bacterium]
MVILVAIIAGAIGAIGGAGVVLARSPKEAYQENNVSPSALPIGLITENRTISLDINSAVTDTVEAIAPAVVTVLNNLRGQSSSLGSSAGNITSGSGIFISPEGYLITNQHVVEGTQSLEVVFANGEQRPAELVGEDPYADLAVLHVDGDIPAYALLGNSDSVKPGETVIAIGSPLGAFQNTVTVGVISATDRAINVTDTYELQGMIQTDAAINQGNSGGPLINLDGEIIGINTLIIRGYSGSATAEGLGFAIPSNTVRAISSQLISSGRIIRPYLGIRWGWITPEIALRYNLPVEYGVFLTDVIAGGPADHAGLETNDIIIAINGTPLDEDNPFTNLLFEFEPGEEISLTILQDGKTITTNLMLGELPD